MSRAPNGGKHPLRPGDRVRIISRAMTCPEYGTIVEHVPSRGGYLVRPDGLDYAGGFGYGELDPNPIPPRTRYERILSDDF